MRLKAENARAGGVERQSQALSVILEQVDRLDTLLRRLLNVTERDEPRRERVALTPFLERCVTAHADLAAAKQVRLECSGVEEDATFDPDQMRRAIDNLILNAIHAAPAGSLIQVTARREADMLVLSVHDQGSGPSAEIRDHLFEPRHDVVGEGREARQVLESIRNFDRGPADRQSGPDRLIADQSLDSAVNFSAELPSRFSLLNPGAPAPRRLFVDFAIIALHPIKPIGQA